MNDFDYDVKEKKRIAAGARARKCGSKSKRCTLPSDYLTPKQKRGLNGEMKTYNLSAPMSYGEFRDIPEDLQREYLTKLYVDWCISLTEISKMFKCSPETVRQACKQFGINTANRGHRASYAQMQHWYDWLNGGGSVIEDTEKMPIPPIESSNEPTTSESETVQSSLVNGCIRLRGTSSTLAEAIISTLNWLKNCEITVEIEFEVV